MTTNKKAIETKTEAKMAQHEVTKTKQKAEDEKKIYIAEAKEEIKDLKDKNDIQIKEALKMTKEHQKNHPASEQKPIKLQ